MTDLRDRFAVEYERIKDMAFWREYVARIAKRRAGYADALVSATPDTFRALQGRIAAIDEITRLPDKITKGQPE